MALIPLGRGLSAQVDDVDVPALVGKSWHIADRVRRRYAQTCWWDAMTKRRCHALMHRLLMQAPAGTAIDHINGNGLDNRRENLRFASAHENAWNRLAQKKAKGVFRYRGTFQARILWQGEELYLGQFTNELSAAAVYDAAALRLFGRYARLNGVPDLAGLDASLAGIRRLEGMRERAIYREVIR